MDSYTVIVAAMTQGSHPSPFLTPVVHPALMHFCNEVGSLLGLGPTSDRRVQGQRAMLVSFLDDFVGETVLHRVWVEAKSHVSTLLSDKFAFKAAGHQRQHGARLGRSGRPILPVRRPGDSAFEMT